MTVRIRQKPPTSDSVLSKIQGAIRAGTKKKRAKKKATNLAKSNKKKSAKLSNVLTIVKKKKTIQKRTS